MEKLLSSSNSSCCFFFFSRPPPLAGRERGFPREGRQSRTDNCNVVVLPRKRFPPARTFCTSNSKERDESAEQRGATLQFPEERDESTLSCRLVSLSRSNRIQSATDLFFSMVAADLTPSPHACNSLLSSSLRNNAPLPSSLAIFAAMRRKKSLTAHAYSLLLKRLPSTQAVRMLRSAERDEAVDAIVYNTAISACAKEKNWVGAELLWRDLKSNGLSGTRLTYSLLVSTFVQSGQTDLAVSAYREMVDVGHSPGEDVMKGVIASSAHDGNSGLAVRVLGRMMDEGIKPNLTTFNSVLNSVAKARDLGTAIRVYRLLLSSGHSPDSYTWNALLNALYTSQRYADCVRLFRKIGETDDGPLDVHLYNTVLMACRKLRMWETSLQLLWQMERDGVHHVGTATYNLVIGCCENARQPKAALEVYYHMIHTNNVFPDTFTYLSLIRACVWGSLWTHLHSILEKVEPDVSLYNALIHGYCLKGEITSARKLYEKMRSNGLQPDGKTRSLMLQHIPDNSLRYHPRYVNIRPKHAKHKNKRACK